MLIDVNWPSPVAGIGETAREGDVDTGGEGLGGETGREIAEARGFAANGAVFARKGLTLLGIVPALGGVRGTELDTSVVLRASPDFTTDGGRASLWAWNGFLNTVFCFLGPDVGFISGDGFGVTTGLTVRVTGTKSSLSTWTKLDGKRPIIRRSRRRRPVHHCPSPALRHSIKSPSTNPRSFFVSPPQE